MQTPANSQYNLPYLINDLGCTDYRIRKDPKLLDQFLLLKAVIDGSLPKLLFSDIKIFQFICEDIFPEIETPQLSNRHRVRQIIEEQLEKSRLSSMDHIVQNIINIHMAMTNRHGIMCIGDPMSGKTTAVKVLVATLKALHADEVQSKTNLFMQKKAQMMDIETVIERGVV